MPRNYKPLLQQEFINGIYKIVPIRDEDKYAIMQWRNEQIDILRQKEPLTKEKQECYFNNVIDKLFEQEKPNQLLFSFLENDILIGYGGLVHIDWESKNAEISFITITDRNKDETTFSKDFESYLLIIFEIAYRFLDFNKLHTTFYDIPERNSYQMVLERLNFSREAHLKSHLFFNDRFVDVFIYSHFR